MDTKKSRPFSRLPNPSVSPVRRLSASGLNAEKSRRPAHGAAASAQLTKITVGNNAISGNGLPAWRRIGMLE